MTHQGILPRSDEAWVRYLEPFVDKQLVARFELSHTLASAVCKRISDQFGSPLIIIPVDMQERMVVFEAAVPNSFLRKPENPFVAVLFSAYYPLACIAFDWDLNRTALEICSRSLREFSFIRVPFSIFASPEEYDGVKLRQVQYAIANRLPDPFPELRMKREQLWSDIFDIP